MHEVTCVATADYRQLRRIIVEHEIAPASLVLRMAGSAAASAASRVEPMAAHPLHATVTPIGRVRARKDR
ncbi:MAG TPA: hypothetical protein VE178_03885 [Silvibacterium sp.]|jgi:hypothetical protein|nr:hypothetical protein [Silvibacterium sp.]